MAADYSDVIKQAARANKQFAFLFVVTLARSPLQIGVTSTRRQLCTLPRPMLTSLTPEVLTASQMASPDDPLTLRSRLGDLIRACIINAPHPLSAIGAITDIARTLLLVAE